MRDARHFAFEPPSAQPTEPAAGSAQPMAHHRMTGDARHGYEYFVHHARESGRGMVNRALPRVRHLVTLAGFAAGSRIQCCDGRTRYRCADSQAFDSILDGGFVMSQSNECPESTFEQSPVVCLAFNILYRLRGPLRRPWPD